MPLGSGISSVVAQAGVVLGIEADRFHRGLDQAERDFTQSTGHMRTELTKLEEAQLKVKLSQESYARAVAKFGPESRSAEQALLRLSKAQRNLSDETDSSTRRSIIFRGHSGEARRELGALTRGGIAASGMFHSLGRQIAYASGAFLGGVGLIAVIKHSIDAAGNLEEQISKVNRVFGREKGEEIHRWAETTATGLGIAKDKAEEFAGTFGAILVPMGVARKEAGDMSVELVKMAADLGSFYNRLPVDALDALRSGIVGMPRPLRQFGIVLTKTRVDAEALSAGLVKADVDMRKVALAQDAIAIAQAKLTKARKDYGAGTTQVKEAEDRLQRAELALEKAIGGKVPQLTEQQKVMARYLLIMHDGALAHGDFQKTSKRLEQQEKILHAQMDELSEGLGKALIPNVTKVITHLNEWISRGLKTGEIQRQINSIAHTTVEIVKLLVAGFKTLWPIVATTADAVGGLTELLKLLVGATIAVKIAKMAGLFDAIRVSVRQTGTAAKTAEAETVGAMAGIRAAAIATSRTIKAALISTGFGIVVVAIGAAVSYIIFHLDKVKGWLNAFVGFWARVWTGIKRTALQALLAILEPFSHLPWKLGGWARDAKDAVHAQLDKLAVQAGKDGTAAGENWKQGFLGPILQAIDQLDKGIGSPGGTPSLGIVSGKIATKKQKALVSKALEVGPGSGITYVWGGNSPRDGFDCSGYLWYVYKQNGIDIPRTSQAQFHDPNGIDTTGHERPGDGVYFRTRGPGAAPQHCGFYIGGGRFIEYFHSGQPAKINTIRGKGGYMGARGWLRLKQTTGGGGGGGGGGDLLGLGGDNDQLRVGTKSSKKTKKKKAPAFKLPAGLQTDLIDAQSTEGLEDDIKVLERIDKYLTRLIAKSKNVELKEKALIERARIRKKLAETRRKEELAAIKAAVGIEKAKVDEASRGGTETRDITTEVTDAEGNKTTKVVGKEFVGVPTVQFDPSSGKYVVVQLKPDVDALRNELNFLLEKLLPKIDKEIAAVKNAIKRLKRHPKKNRKTLDALRAKLAALRKERKDIIALANDLAVSIGELDAALALPPEPETSSDQKTPDVPDTPEPDGNITPITDTGNSTQSTDLQGGFDSNLVAYLGAKRDLSRDFASNVIGAAFAGRLGAVPNEPTGQSTTINVQNFFPTSPADPHLFSRSLSFELKALLG